MRVVLNRALVARIPSDSPAVTSNMHIGIFAGKEVAVTHLIADEGVRLSAVFRCSDGNLPRSEGQVNARLLLHPSLKRYPRDDELESPETFQAFLEATE